MNQSQLHVSKKKTHLIHPHKGVSATKAQTLCDFAECCRVLQCAAMCCSVLKCVAVCCSVLQCVAVCCSVLQCVAVCCSIVRCVVVCYSALKCAAVCCRVLSCVAVRCHVSPCQMCVMEWNAFCIHVFVFGVLCIVVPNSLGIYICIQICMYTRICGVIYTYIYIYIYLICEGP